MHYYIDGYNLLFRLSGSRNDFAKQRQALIDELNHKVGLLGLNVTIVFDAQHQPESGSRSHYKKLKVIFSEPNETADDRILEEIKIEQKPHLHTVVTSDKKLAWFARRCLAKTESVEQFIEWLDKRYANRIRQNREAPQQVASPKKAIVPKKVVQAKPPPESTLPAEKCTDYYLEQFQKNFEEIEKQTIKKPKKETQKKPTTKSRKKPPRHDEDKPLSDIARWEEIFERRLESEMD